MQNAKNILIFAPYGQWLVHHQLDIVIGKALQLRGCHVLALLCNGIFENCPLTKGITDRQFCKNQCYNVIYNIFLILQIPTIDLNYFLNDDVKVQCKEWSNSVSDVKNAIFESIEMGKWLSGAMHSFFMAEKLDYSDQRILLMYRSLLYNGALIKKAFDELIKHWYPDHVFCYSAFHGYYRVLFQILKKRNIPVLVHERAELGGNFLLLNGESLSNFNKRYDNWNLWQSIPLNSDELKKIDDYIGKRESPSSTNMYKPFDYITKESEVKKQLRIPPDADIVLLFTSCDWEVGILKMDLDFRFNSQISWLNYIIDNFDIKNTYLIIRYHPGLYRKDGTTGISFLEQAFKLNKKIAKLKKNIRVIMPYEKITSYSLIWNAKTAFVLRSSIGLECLIRGVSCLSELKNMKSIAGVDLINYDNDGGSAINKMLINNIKKTETFQIENLRKAYRAAYFIFFRLSYYFKTFTIKNFYSPCIDIKDIRKLLPGHDPVLDQVCNHVINGKHLYPLPTDVEKNRSNQEENKFLEKKLFFIKQKREYVLKETLSSNLNYPLISTIHLSNIVSDNSYFKQSLNSSRHKNIEYIKIDLNNISIIYDLILSIKNSIIQSKGDFIYIGTDNVYFDESFLSSSVDLLNANIKYDAILTGAWISNLNNNLIDEIFTERKKENLDDIYNIFSSNILIYNLFVWKKSSLIEVIERNLNIQNINDFITYFLEKIISNGTEYKIYKLQLPYIILYGK